MGDVGKVTFCSYNHKWNKLTIWIPRLISDLDEGTELIRLERAAQGDLAHACLKGDKCPFMHGPQSADIILEEPSKIGYNKLTRAQDQFFKFSGDPFQIGKEAEEILIESSLGFDVLVDNAIMDADYLHKSDDFNNGFIPNERNMHFERKENYDPLRSGYESSSKLEMDGHNELVDYQYYRKLQHSVDGDSLYIKKDLG
ncbi:hypothetical protein HPP92_018888 [Vanilla planifolia]|uniref:C3H1-type domain-containing protein n=1 Tax=Vanilla planifolia TaxID=51239 RepID=A0A835Q9M6_VANPL|nr:hypothetical protein HPP92_018888 [Vanilla planifolia]